MVRRLAFLAGVLVVSAAAACGGGGASAPGADAAVLADAAVAHPDAGATPDGGDPGLPSPWKLQDIGVVGAAGTATGDGTAFTVTSASPDVAAGAVDGFTFVYRPWTGDGRIVARVASLTHTHDYAKAGVMIRQSLDSNAPFAYALLWPTQGAVAAWRETAGADAIPGQGVSATPPKWLALERSGSSFSASISPDGVTWQALGTHTIAMPEQVLIGLAVTSHDVARVATAAFDSVAVTGPAPAVCGNGQLEGGEECEGGECCDTARCAFRAGSCSGGGTCQQGVCLPPGPVSACSPLPADAVNVRDHGARGDGATDDTAEIQAALDAGAGKTVYFPSGTYMVDALSTFGNSDGNEGGVVPRSNTNLCFAPDAVLKALPTASSRSVVLRIQEVTNVLVEGGVVEGELKEHLASTANGAGEWGYGIGLYGADRVTIRNMTLRYCFGDGLFIEDSPTPRNVPSTNVTVQNVVSTYNRRQGLSIISVDGLLVESSIFENTGRYAFTGPGAGVDIEPWGEEPNHVVKNAVFRNNLYRNNVGRGFVFQSCDDARCRGVVPGFDITGVKIIGGTITGNGSSGIIFYLNHGANVVSGVTISGNGEHGIEVGSSSNMTLAGNFISANAGNGIHVYNPDAAHVEPIAIRDNVIRKDAGAQPAGISVYSQPNVTVARNDLRSAGGTDLVVSGTSVASSGNWLTGGANPFPPLTIASGGAIDSSLGTDFVLAATSDAPAVADPANASLGARLGLTVRNGGTAAVTSVRWGASFAPAAWTSLAAGQHRTIDFVFDGSGWIEVRRGADLAN